MRPRLLQPTLPAAHATILRFGCFRLFSSFTSPTISTARVWPTPQLEWRATLGSTIACSAWESAFSSSAMWPCLAGTGQIQFRFDSLDNLLRHSSQFDRQHVLLRLRLLQVIELTLQQGRVHEMPVPAA